MQITVMLVSSGNHISLNILVISIRLSVYKPCAVKKDRVCFKNTDNKLVIAKRNWTFMTQMPEVKFWQTPELLH